MAAVRVQETGRVTEGNTDADLQLIERIAKGDHQALTDIYLRHGQVLLHYLQHFTTDRGLAEELLQDTLVAVWKNADSYRGEARVQAWLFGIARRRACKRIRQRELPQADLVNLEIIPAPDLKPETALLASITREELTNALERLIPIHREVLLLTFVHELSYAETADVLGVPTGTVKSRLSNAKRSLRALLCAGEEVDQ